jgi:hypothetical protein
MKTYAPLLAKRFAVASPMPLLPPVTTEAELKRQQRQAWQHQQTRQSLSPWLFTAGALAMIRYANLHGTEHRPWLTGLWARRPSKVAAIALANKFARIMTKGERYREPVALAA